jgi:sugar lactone lactonase YvrE
VSATTPGHNVLAGGLLFPECPRWRDGELWFVDGPTVKIVTATGSMRTLCAIDCQLLIGLSFTAAGDILVGSPTDRKVFKVTPGGAVSDFADLSAHTDHLINELMVLADGSVIVNDVGYDLLHGAESKAVRLIRITTDKNISRTGSPLNFANGLVATDAGEGLLVAEHGTGKIWHFRLAGAQGLDAGEVVCAVPTKGLDGIALAKDGSIWYTDAYDGSVGRVSRSGKVLQRFVTGYSGATSCVLNEDESILFVTVIGTMPDATFRFARDGAVLAVRLKRDD